MIKRRKFLKLGGVGAALLAMGETPVKAAEKEKTKQKVAKKKVKAAKKKVEEVEPPPEKDEE